MTGYFATAPHLSRVLVWYSLIVGGVAELAYLYSVWPDLTPWTIVAATGLTSIMVLQVYVMCSMVFRLLAVWMDTQFHAELGADDE